MDNVIPFPDPMPRTNPVLEDALNEVEHIIKPFREENPTNYFGEFSSVHTTGLMLENLIMSLERIKKRPVIDFIEQKNFETILESCRQITSIIMNTVSTSVRSNR